MIARVEREPTVRIRLLWDEDLVFQQVREWEQFLVGDPATCVVARWTGCSPIASAEASRLAFNRIRVLERRKRTKTARALPLGGLLDEPSPDES